MEESLVAKEGFAEVYEKVKPIVWILRVTSSGNNKYFTGFTVAGSGLVMTCARGFSQLSDEYKIVGRRLNEDRFDYALSVVGSEVKWDLALLQVRGGLVDAATGKFARNGSLKTGERVMTIMHPVGFKFIGLFTFGSVCYQCFDEVRLPSRLSMKTCGKFKFLERGKSPKYRIMGHIWYDQTSSDERAFEKKLNPEVPIIQCNGLSTSCCSFGGPIFNTRGDIVGIVSHSDMKYDIGIHLGLVCKFMELEGYAIPFESNLKGKVQKKHKQNETSKKRKRGAQNLMWRKLRGLRY